MSIIIPSGEEVMALSVKNPWAYLIALKKKSIETRTWYTKYRGKLLICASQTEDKKIIAASIDQRHKLLQTTSAKGYRRDMHHERILQQAIYEIKSVEYNGMALCLVDLKWVKPMEQKHEIHAKCPVYEGAYAWGLDNVQMIKPFPVKGKLGIFKFIPETDIETYYAE